MVNRQQLKNAFQSIEAFIRQIHDQPSPNERLSPSEEAWEVMFSTEDGTCFLDRSEATQYRHCLNDLVKAIDDPAQISPKAVEKLLQRSILAALDPKGKNLSPFGDRCSGEIQRLREDLTSTPRTFGVFYRVEGLSSEGLPQQVGDAKFVVFDDSQMDRFRQRIAQHRGDTEKKKARSERTILRSDLLGKTVAYIEVQALEFGAAKLLAQKKLQLTVDAINFFSDLIPDSSRAYLGLPGESVSVSATIPVLEVGEHVGFHIGWEKVGRLGELSLPKLLDADSSRQIGFSRVREMLSETKNKLEDVLLASIRWAGRATARQQARQTTERKGEGLSLPAVGRGNEEAFLLYVIALESLILADTGANSQLLGCRAAYLIGRDDKKARQKINSRLKQLTNVRNSIVHDGHYEVTDADLGSIRSIAKECIVRVCASEELQQIPTPEELGKWLDARTSG